MRRRVTAVVLFGLSALAAMGCAAGDGAASPSAACAPLEVVATTSILGDVLANIVQEDGTVEVLVPRGADPHAYQVSAREAAAMRRADLMVVNGLGLEAGMGGAVEAAADDGVAVVEAASYVDPLPFAVEAGEGGEVPGDLDPHFWTDPARMAEVVTGLGEALAAADPACPERWRQAAAAYRQQVLALDEEIETILEVVPADRRKLVTNHHSLAYFADRYGFTVLGAIVPGGSTLAEPSPADLAALAGILESAGVRAVFADATRPSDLAETLAAELGEEVTVVELFTGSLGEPGSGAETYLSMQLANARLIADALGDG